MSRSVALVGIVSLLPHLVSASSFAPSAGPAPAHAVVAVQDMGIVRLVDPATGEVVARLGRFGSLASVVVAEDGSVFVAVAGDADRGTEVIAVQPADGRVESIGVVPGRAGATAVASAEDRLLFAAFPPSSSGESLGLPSGVVGLPLPETWQSVRFDRVAARDVGSGILASDGRRWYRLALAVEGERSVGLALKLLAFDGAIPTESSLTLPMSGYHALFLAPDGRTLYAVDFNDLANRRNTVHVVDVADAARPTLVETVGLPGPPAKATLCAAALAPHGDRFYLPTRGADGRPRIAVFDTATWQQLKVFPLSTSAYCLTVSHDGDRLHAAVRAAGGYDLLTLDAQTGAELHRVPLALDGCCPFLVAAAAEDAAID